MQTTPIKRLLQAVQQKLMSQSTKQTNLMPHAYIRLTEFIPQQTIESLPNRFFTAQKEDVLQYAQFADRHTLNLAVAVNLYFYDDYLTPTERLVYRTLARFSCYTQGVVTVPKSYDDLADKAQQIIQDDIENAKTWSTKRAEQLKKVALSHSSIKRAISVLVELGFIRKFQFFQSPTQRNRKQRHRKSGCVGNGYVLLCADEQQTLAFAVRKGLNVPAAIMTSHEQVIRQEIINSDILEHDQAVRPGNLTKQENATSVDTTTFTHNANEALVFLSHIFSDIKHNKTIDTIVSNYDGMNHINFEQLKQRYTQILPTMNIPTYMPTVFVNNYVMLLQHTQQPNIAAALKHAYNACRATTRHVANIVAEDMGEMYHQSIFNNYLDQASNELVKTFKRYEQQGKTIHNLVAYLCGIVAQLYKEYINTEYKEMFNIQNPHFHVFKEISEQDFYDVGEMNEPFVVHAKEPHSLEPMSVDSQLAYIHEQILQPHSLFNRAHAERFITFIAHLTHITAEETALLQEIIEKQCTEHKLYKLVSCPTIFSKYWQSLQLPAS